MEAAARVTCRQQVTLGPYKTAGSCISHTSPPHNEARGARVARAFRYDERVETRRVAVIDNLIHKQRVAEHLQGGPIHDGADRNSPVTPLLNNRRPESTLMWTILVLLRRRIEAYPAPPPPPV